MKHFKRKGSFCVLVIALLLGIHLFFDVDTLFAKDNSKEIIKLSDKVLPDFSFANSTDDEIKVMTILHHAKAKKRIPYEDILPGEEQYHEIDLKEYEKTSKKLFGEVIPHGLRDKLEGGFQTYYDKATKTIYQEVFYDPGDVTVKRNKRILKKLKKGSYVVENWDSFYYPLFLEKKPTKKMQVFIKKVGKKYIITDLKLSDLPEKVLKLSTADVKKQIENIKKWFVKQPKNVVRKDFKKDGNSYSVLMQDNDIIFIYEKEGTIERRYYYKEGVPVRIMHTEDGDLFYTYDLSYDKKGYLVNGKREIEGQPESVMGFFATADYTYNKVDAWR